MHTIGMVVLLAAPGGASPKAPAPVSSPKVRLPAIPQVKAPALLGAPKATPAKPSVSKGSLKPMRARAFYKLRRRLRHARGAQARLQVLKRGLKKWYVDLNQSEILLKGFQSEALRIEAFRTIRPRMVNKREGLVGWWTVDGADFRPAQVRRFQNLFQTANGKSIVDFGGSQFKP